MRSNFERHLARKWKTEGLSYSEISRRLSISRNSAINLCRYNKKRCLKKTGPRQKLTKNMKLSIKRTIEHLQSNFQKINSSKLIAECDLNCSTRTVQRHLKAVGYKYRYQGSRRIKELIIFLDGLAKTTVGKRQYLRMRKDSHWMGQTIGEHMYKKSKIYSSKAPM